MGNIEKRVKEEWSKLPREAFEVLTFGELKVGDKYIALPLPGDNEGHGGFKGTHHIFQKTEKQPGKYNSRRLDERYNLSCIPDDMLVIKIG